MSEIIFDNNPKFADRRKDLSQPPQRHVWLPRYERIKMGSEDAIVAAISGSGVELILKLAQKCPEPYGILYVLLVAIKTRPRRYQLDGWLDYEALTEYFENYRRYFEGDGRHHIWVRCGDESLIVYDKHEILYLYGAVDLFRETLESLGYTEGEVRIDFAHSHYYNREYHADEVSIVESGEYMRFDLVPGQDYDEGDPRYS